MAFRDRYRPAASAPARRRSPAVVFAVGRRVFIASTTAPLSSVPLTDDSGVTVCGSLRDGAEVEIVAWRPLGSQGTRYLVRSSSKGIEGWLGAADIRGSKAKAAGVPVTSPSRVAR
jgi:hypothetical protein